MVVVLPTGQELGQIVRLSVRLGGLIGLVGIDKNGLYPMYKRYTIPLGGHFDLKFSNSTIIKGGLPYFGTFIILLSATGIEVLKNIESDIISFEFVSGYTVRIHNNHESATLGVTISYITFNT
ncbi:hypothetical protein [uncultured Bacteroides sp.]|uniref:hypothetical protein n=1 Tax=uncultured Bacteroides sp. TaxID=162156 RepID=UPI0026389188|nr:hypothetical protein [uncultured Bacteroides sp.]